MKFEKPLAPVEVNEKEKLEARLSDWPETFYEEIDARTRMHLLDLADEAGLTPDENPVRRKILALRYEKADDGKTYADRFLRVFMELKYVFDSGAHTLFRKSKEKQIRRALETIEYRSYSDADDLTHDLYCNELLHMGRLYINLCRTDKQYGSVILGIGRMKKESLTEKIARDIHTSSIAIPAQYGMTEELKDWSRALQEAFRMMFPASADLLYALKAKSDK